MVGKIGEIAGAAAGIGGLGGGAAGGAQQVGKDFASFVTDAAQSAVDTMRTGEKMSIKGITGKADLNDVVAAVNSAEITLQTQYGRRVLDARPSDSIALAARVDAPIWVADEVLAEAGIADETEGSHEDEEAKLAEFKRFLEEVDPEDFQG